MNQLLDELMKNAENNTHLVVFELDQTKELIDEDIDVLPLPFSTKKSN